MPISTGNFITDRIEVVETSKDLIVALQSHHLYLKLGEIVRI
jgi:hypothetical protein